MFYRKLLAIAALSLCLPYLTVAKAQEQAAELWQALQQGGKVIMMRHASVDRTMGESFLLDDSCFSEKNLDEFGIKQAKAIKTAFKQQHVKVGKVYASPHCRTKDTAELAFGQFEVNPILRLIRAIPDEQAAVNMTKVRQILSDYQQPENLVLVTHRPNVAEITNQRLGVAQMAIFEPLGDGLFDFLGVLSVPVEQ